MVEHGKCQLKKNINKLINGVNFGRGKTFNYKYISKNDVLVYKKGIQMYIKKEQFLNYFRLLN